MANQDIYVAEGTVIENLPNTTFRIKIDGSSETSLLEKSVLCTIAGRMRLNYVRLLPGDRVRCEVSALDTSRGRIIYKKAGTDKLIIIDSYGGIVKVHDGKAIIVLDL